MEENQKESVKNLIIETLKESGGLTKTQLISGINKKALKKYIGQYDDPALMDYIQYLVKSGQILLTPKKADINVYSVQE